MNQGVIPSQEVADANVITTKTQSTVDGFIVFTRMVSLHPAGKTREKILCGRLGWHPALDWQENLWLYTPDGRRSSRWDPPEKTSLKWWNAHYAPGEKARLITSPTQDNFILGNVFSSSSLLEFRWRAGCHSSLQQTPGGLSLSLAIPETSGWKEGRKYWPIFGSFHQVTWRVYPTS